MTEERMRTIQLLERIADCLARASDGLEADVVTQVVWGYVSDQVRRATITLAQLKTHLFDREASFPD